MELNTRVPPFTQTFLKQYCDRKAWEIPGGQGRLDRVQASPSEAEGEGEMGLLSDWGSLLRSGSNAVHGGMNSLNRA